MQQRACSSDSTINFNAMNRTGYAVPFGQRGLMAGLGLEGSKITHIHPGS
jgi:lipid-binding SYLF domain-containing protein